MADAIPQAPLLVSSGAAAIFWPGAPLIEIMLASQVLNGILLPAVLLRTFRGA